MPKPYPPEFRRRALDLVASGRTVFEVAGSLGIAQSALYRWRSQELIDTGRKPGTSRAESEELKAARCRIRDLEEEVKILRRAAAAVEQVVPPKGRLGIVAQLAADGGRVKRACVALGVSKAGYYDWGARAPSARSIRHAWLTDVIGCVTPHPVVVGERARLEPCGELLAIDGGHWSVSRPDRNAAV